MKIHIEPTSRIVEVARQGGDMTVPARVWQGKTDGGIEVTCLITRLAACRDQDLDELDQALNGTEPAVANEDACRAWPARLVL